MKVELADGAYTAATVSLVLLHVICAAFLIAAGRIYWYLEHPYLTYYADLLAPSSDRHFRLIGTLIMCVGLLHVLQLADMMRSAVKSRRASTPIVPEESTKSRRTSSTSRTASAAMLAAQRVTSNVHRLFGRKSLLGVESAHFEGVFIGRELAEVASQVYQAYRSSLLIGRLWINHCYVTIVVVNCWSTPLFQRLLQHSPAAQRAGCLAIDFVLNICSSIVLPMVIFIPYLDQYEPEAFTFGMAFVYDDLAFGSLVSENQSIFAISLADCGSKLVPHLSAFSGLVAVGSLLERKATRAPKRQATSSSSKGPAASLVPTRPKRGHRLLHGVFIVCGIAILCIHLAAVTRLYGVEVPGCKQTIHPWFATKYACSVYDFNCYRHNETPSLDAQSLDFLDESALTMLVILHCPALVVPKAIRNFHNLLGMEIYNSTIVEWPKEASISASIHQRMAYVILFRVNATKLPDGLLQPLPTMLQDIEISVSNLTTLPEDLHERWRSLSLFYLEYTQMKTVPETLLKLEVNEFSLIGNQFETLPDWLSVQTSYHELALARNPIKALPSVVTSGLTFDIIHLENTRVQTLPDWVAASVGDVVYLSGSPVCEAQQDDRIVQHAKLLCNERDPRGSGMYPQDLVLPQRQL
ncbi:hypothetical protein Gpo141_00001584 [Globisporangium polare]